MPFFQLCGHVVERFGKPAQFAADMLVRPPP